MSQPKPTRTIAFAGAIALSLLSMRTVRAQETPPVPALPEAKPATPATDTFTAEDAALLRKAVTNLRAGLPLQIESALTMTVQAKGLSLVIEESLKMTAKIPGKLHADLLVTPPAMTSRTPIRYQVISDGQKTLVYRPGTKQYTVRKLAGEGKGNGPDFFETGLFFGFLGGENAGELTNLDMMKLGGAKITAATEKLGASDVRVIRVADDAQGFRIGFFVDPATAKIVQMDLNGDDNGNKVLVVERIIKLVPAALPLAASTFVVAPPPGATRVPKISIGDF